MPPVALITGASSGIGLALTKHLLSQSWTVLLCDLNPPSDPLPLNSSSHFHATDVRSWDSQASAFTRAFDLHSRLDFVALNAGIDDRDDIFSAAVAALERGESTAPSEPNMATFETNLLGVYYGLKLAAFHMLRNPAPGRGGRIAVTASDAGYLSLPAIPQYTATKHGVVGLVRAVAPGAKKAGIAVNAVAPSLVPTALAPTGLLDAMPRDKLTGMEVVIRGFEMLGGFGNVGTEGWGEREPTGKVLEVRGKECIYREEAMVQGESMPAEVATAWEKAYEIRNKGFALKGQEKKE